MTALSAERLLRLPVRVRGIQLGRPTDLVLDRDRRRVLGVDVLCGDDARRFLPFSVATVGPDALDAPSPLVLLAEAELSFYTRRGSTFAGLRGKEVARRGVALGTLVDLELGADGAVTAAVVAAEGGTRRVELAPDVELAPPRRVRAAS